MKKTFKASAAASAVQRPVSVFRRWTSKNSFREKVLLIVSKIPKGKTLTYKQVAAKAGYPHAARAVGTIMKSNFDPKIPCHRVIRSDGRVGGYNRGGSAKKIKLLKSEGVFRINYLAKLAK